MRNLSVTAFIHILFSIAILILITTFMLFLSWDKDRQKINEYKRYQLISITFLSKLQLNPGKEALDKLYSDLHVKEVPKKLKTKIVEQIQSEGETVFTGGSALGQVRVFEIEDEHYIYVQRMEHNLLLQDDRPEKYYFEIAIALAIFLIGLLLVLYLAVLRKLYPLKKLHKQIQRFAQGDMNTRVTYLYDDEIGKIAKSFDDAIVHINNLSKSKIPFLRNLMHELKTPITAIRGITETILDDDDMQIAVSVSETKVRFATPDITLTSKVIDGTFPDYTRVIPQGNTRRLEVDAAEFAKAVDRVATVSSERSRAVKLSLDEDRLVLSVNAPDSGAAEEELAVAYGDDRLEIGFNAKYLLEIASQVDRENAVFMFNSAGDPTLMREGNDTSAVYVVMPMRV